ncbi:two component transcriptional regulator, LuxR family [Neorhodopirellula lusitana]|uniref:Two component transcriptional regulator, LuxR family n=1 Tax=Neorhodopirellula lusitana TaxID=445327 RepID=A0ABY1QF28_9BACT|nr:response regulator transcription factor [Neorhodopirellula lusitana]SMP66700.1 two component transcriptional regulator, LuxR family [Neorhodopirellula lusitana]
MTQIVIVDDHPSTRFGLATRIELEPDLQICGEAADVDEALELIGQVCPDVAVIDVSLKTGSGIDLIKQVKESHPRVKMLVWSMYEEGLYAERALRAGALGYINKQQATDTIVEAIRTIMAGDLFLSKELSAKMLHRVIQGKESVALSPVDSLSDRELETFRLIGQGMNTKDIAKAMDLRPKTVETYRARIKDKLEIDEMAALTREATQWVLENG